jgi:pyridinium-3,5-bisthiocarboxylic acid mononucleotide nickel chelatase
VNACYIDCFSGASGDKFVAAFIDLGVPVELIREQLSKVDLGGYKLTAEQAIVSGIAATRIDVRLGEARVVRTWASIREMLEASGLSAPVKKRSISIFERIARAESKIHAKPLDLVHFHEVGAVDSIIDVVAAAVALDFFELERVLCSPVAVGSGMVRTDHGALPVPAPATLEILSGVPVYSGGVSGELTTPTGAAILAGCVDSFGDMPLMSPTAVGYGAGQRELEVPNVLRVILGQLSEPAMASAETVAVIETTVDNTSPQILGAVFEMLLAAGALDVWTSSVQMKKQRPGVVMTVLARPADVHTMEAILLRETDTLGVRMREESRLVAHRTVNRLKTSLGVARVKIGRYGSEITSIMPEFEDVRRIAARHDLPIKLVFERIRREAQARLGETEPPSAD